MDFVPNPVQKANPRSYKGAFNQCGKLTATLFNPFGG